MTLPSYEWFGIGKHKLVFFQNHWDKNLSWTSGYKTKKKYPHTLTLDFYK